MEHNDLDELIKQALSENLPRLRKGKRNGKHWSQDRLAKEAGLTTAGYGEIERGNNCPSISSLIKITLALGYDTYEPLIPKVYQTHFFPPTYTFCTLNDL